MAVSTDHLEFVSHSCVQTLLNEVWTGPIKSLGTKTSDFLLTFLFPPFLLSFNFRTESEMKGMIQMEDESVSALKSAISTTFSMVGGDDSDSSDSEQERNNTM